MISTHGHGAGVRQDMQTPQHDPQPNPDDNPDAEPAEELSATERAFAEIERRSRAMEEGWRHSGM